VNYTILHSSGLSGSFSSLVLAPNFQGTIAYTLTDVLLQLKITQPFLFFPFSNPNTQSVGQNLDALNAAGILNSDLISVIDSLAGQSNAVINDALDRMHSAQYSAYPEIQAVVGAQLLTMMHRAPYMKCYCNRPKRFWLEPFGNWLNVQPKNFEVGFDADTKGIAGGYDVEFLEGWSMGLGGIWDETYTLWHENHGFGHIHGRYGSFYTDYKADNFYIGASVIAGVDHFETNRFIQFLTTDRKAHSKCDGLNVMGQLSGAYFFGPPACLLYPYANIDFFHQQAGNFHEDGANGLDLNVEKNISNTFRGETGIALQVQDTNDTQTICISPVVALSYAIQIPITRNQYVTRFAGESIPFKIKGWDQTWQIFAADFGLRLSYKCYSLSGEYYVEMSPEEGNNPLFTQRGNVRLDWSW
jgi:outer membrane autotransporter protein